MNEVLKVAFCGAGGIVRGKHIPELLARNDRFEIVGFYDVVRESAKSAATGNSGWKAYAAYDELLSDERVDLVVIATKPLSTHAPAARKALEAGKNVLLEKPMASTSVECDELIAEAGKRGLVLTIHHNRRLDLDFQALRDVINSGKLGEPLLIENRVIAAGYDGGDIVDWGVHLVDQCLLLNDSPLKEVSAFFRKSENGAADAGFAEATLLFEKGPLVRFSMMPRTKEFLLNGTDAFTRFRVVGTKASFSQRIIESPKDLMNATQNFDNASPDYAVPPYLKIEMKDYYDYLYDSIVGGEPLLVRPEEARNAIRCIELMEESARNGAAQVPASGMIPTGR
ncbi:MAG: Gfo/Idh/MocA family oxidoreductase [Kiritimatiellaeota bacterium]|nr:Gfo/Idh/MocA family oxidoreductase [Kiritimatiellota bacterium]